MLSTFKYQYTSPLKSLKLHVTDNRSFLGKQNCGNSPGRSHEVKQKSSGCIALLQELFRSSQEVVLHLFFLAIIFTCIFHEGSLIISF